MIVRGAQQRKQISLQSAKPSYLCPNRFCSLTFMLKPLRSGNIHYNFSKQQKSPSNITSHWYCYCASLRYSPLLLTTLFFSSLLFSSILFSSLLYSTLLFNTLPSSLPQFFSILPFSSLLCPNLSILEV